jgi:hypothetical protein
MEGPIVLLLLILAMTAPAWVFGIVSFLQSLLEER